MNLRAALAIVYEAYPSMCECMIRCCVRSAGEAIAGYGRQCLNARKCKLETTACK